MEKGLFSSCGECALCIPRLKAERSVGLEPTVGLHYCARRRGWGHLPLAADSNLHTPCGYRWRPLSSSYSGEGGCPLSGA